MTNYFTSDLHLGHQRIIELCNRPFKSVDHMNQVIIENWNRLVQDGDNVFILGDLAMGTIKETIKRVTELNGEKFLVPGNHDRVHPCYPQKAPEGEEMKRLYESVGLTILSNEVTYVPTGSGGKVAWRLCHFPTSGDHFTEDRYPEYRPSLDEGEWLIQGHVHDLWRVRGRQINVGVDMWGFAPVPESILEMIVVTTERFESQPEDFQAENIHPANQFEMLSFS